MQYISILITLFLFQSFKISAKNYILDKKDYMQPPGTELKGFSMFKMEGAKLINNLNGVNRNVKLDMTLSSVRNISVLSKTKFRLLIASMNETKKLSRFGNRMSSKDIEEPLLKIPMIFEKKDDKWTGKPEKGKLNKVQKKEVGELIEILNLEESSYTYEPKKIGDKWKIGLPALKQLLGSSKMIKGSAEVFFKGIKVVKGVECAEIVINLEVEEREEGRNTKLRGEINILRDLKYFEDIKLTGELKMTSFTSKGDNNSSSITGKVLLINEVSIIAPKETLEVTK